MSDNSKKYADPTDEHSKQIIDMFKSSKCLGDGHSNKW